MLERLTWPPENVYQRPRQGQHKLEGPGARVQQTRRRSTASEWLARLILWAECLTDSSVFRRASDTSDESSDKSLNEQPRQLPPQPRPKLEARVIEISDSDCDDGDDSNQGAIKKGSLTKAATTDPTAPSISANICRSDQGSSGRALDELPEGSETPSSATPGLNATGQ